MAEKKDDKEKIQLKAELTKLILTEAEALEAFKTRLALLKFLRKSEDRAAFYSAAISILLKERPIIQHKKILACLGPLSKNKVKACIENQIVVGYGRTKNVPYYESYVQEFAKNGLKKSVNAADMSEDITDLGFNCPITGLVMKEPVVDFKTGRSYEHKALFESLLAEPKLPSSLPQLVPNKHLKEAIRDFDERYTKWRAGVAQLKKIQDKLNKAEQEKLAQNSSLQSQTDLSVPDNDEKLKTSTHQLKGLLDYGERHMESPYMTADGASWDESRRNVYEEYVYNHNLKLAIDNHQKYFSKFEVIDTLVNNHREEIDKMESIALTEFTKNISPWLPALRDVATIYESAIATLLNKCPEIEVDKILAPLLQKGKNHNMLDLIPVFKALITHRIDDTLIRGKVYALGFNLKDDDFEDLLRQAHVACHQKPLLDKHDSKPKPVIAASSRFPFSQNSSSSSGSSNSSSSESTSSTFSSSFNSGSSS